MICKVISRVSTQRYRVQSVTSGMKLTVLNSTTDSFAIDDYVIVNSLHIVGRAGFQKFDGTFTV